ncbi:MAG: hypothetical protein ACM3TN_03435 [Alphaproteobacteria bacterium]
MARHDVVILGTTNLPSTMSSYSSQMHVRIVTNFLMHLLQDGKIRLDPSDEMARPQAKNALKQDDIQHGTNKRRKLNKSVQAPRLT